MNQRVLVLLTFLSRWIDATFLPINFDRKIRALDKTISYIRERPYEMDADVTLGLTIAEANIASTISHENSRYFDKTYLDILRTILLKLDRTRRYLKDHISAENENIGLLHDVLNDPELWMQSIPWKNLSTSTVQPSNNLTTETVINLTMQGEPTGAQSDYCLVQLLQGNCKVPEECVNILIKRGRARGYPLTHRLLIVEVAEIVGCEEMEGISFSNLIWLYCSAILRDLVDVDSAGYPYNTRDLMMEQIVLCGMKGYREFISDRYEDLILGWSRPSGCYSAFGKPREKTGVVRRTSLPTDFGCDSHTTGVAAAVLSLYIRENVENAFN